MKCPTCKSETTVFDSRDLTGSRYRRRQCEKCGLKFTTLETMKHDKASAFVSVPVEKYRALCRAALINDKPRAALAESA